MKRQVNLYLRHQRCSIFVTLMYLCHESVYVEYVLMRVLHYYERPTHNRGIRTNIRYCDDRKSKNRNLKYLYDII